MVASILISPFAGAVIGCFTNYIAIKMLFRPYKEIKIGNIRLPFTPGLIPKEKQRIAMAIGSAVGDKILTGEAVGKSLVKEDIINYITNAVSEAYDCAEENGITINDVGKNFKVGIWEEFSQKMSDRISVLLGEAFSSDGFKEAFSDLLYRYISIGLNKKISEIGCEGILNAVTGAVSNSVSEAFENGSINAAAEKAVWDFLFLSRW